MLTENSSSNHWVKSTSNIFWGEIAPCDHVVQIYESDDIFLDSLAGFVGGGIYSGDCVIVIATKEHLEALNSRLKSFAVDLDALQSSQRFIPLIAEEILSRFMVKGWPDEELFNQTVSDIISKANENHRKIRAFGEMVALLWAQGNCGATVQLEHLWNKFCSRQAFSLFCAYPKSGFTGDIISSMNDICCTHSKVISGNKKSMTDIYFRNSN